MNGGNSWLMLVRKAVCVWFFLVFMLVCKGVYELLHKGVFSRQEFEERQRKLIERVLEVWYCANVGEKKDDSNIHIYVDEDVEDTDFKIATNRKPQIIMIECNERDAQFLPISGTWKSILKPLTEFYLKESPQEIKDFWDNIIKTVPNEKLEEYSIMLDCGIRIKDHGSANQILHCVRDMITKIGVIDHIEIELKK